MKKLLTLLLVLILSFSVVLTLVACGGDGDGDGAGDNTADGGADNGGNTGGDNGGNTGANNGGNTGGDNGGNAGGDNGGNAGGDNGGNAGGEGGGEDTSKYFNEDGELILFDESKPTFKFVTGSDIGNNAATINDIANQLNGLCEATVKVENYQSTPQTVEILVGTVNTRGDEYKYNKYDLGQNGYVVKQVGTKIIVQGGSANALTTAINHLKEKVFGLKKSNDPFEYHVMADSTNKEYIQGGYTVSQITVAGNSLKNYVLTYTKGNSTAKKAAEALQTTLYTECGIYLKIETSPAAGTPTVFINALANSGVGNGYSAYVDDNGDLKIDCEFDYKLSELCTSFTDNFILSGRGTVAFSKGTIETRDIRNIYYEDFGAMGDGETNDFKALKDTHDKANTYGHIVHAKLDGSANYYIGSTGGDNIDVMTDTYWHGCTFTFDDSTIAVHSSSRCPGGGASNCMDCANRSAAIFNVTKTQKAVDVASKFAYVTPSTPLNGGYGEADNTTKIEDWDLPYLALVKITAKYHKIYVRGGNKENQANADSGDHQCEFILIHPDGTIDPTTPLSWDYHDVAWASAENVDPKYVTPITIDGGGAYINTIANAPGEVEKNEYNQFYRNIYVKRSNTTIKNINHRLLEEGEYRAPYAGILTVNHVNNVTFRDITLQAARRRWQGTVQQGTYEIGGMGGNDIKYYNVDAINFFSDGTDWISYDRENNTPGNLHMGGTMGTNYCRNFLFENCTLNSFDSHKGLGNVTLRNCEIGAASMQGSGDILIENHTAYMSGYSHDVIGLRADYGSTWRGTLTMRNIEIRYDVNFDYTKGNPQNFITIFETNNYERDAIYESFYNESTGKYEMKSTFTNYMPSEIYIENVSLNKYNYTGFDPITRTFQGLTLTAANDKVYLFNKSIYGYLTEDIRTAFANKYMPADKITVVGCQARIVLPDTPQFSDCKFVITDSPNTYQGT